jgi:hypothetical protein
MRANLVGHCYRPSNNNDKVYMCCIRETVDGNTGFPNWAVIAKWGRRGKKLSNQVKGSYSIEANAVHAQMQLWMSQSKAGYLDIESKEYADQMRVYGVPPLTLASAEIKKNLEHDDQFPINDPNNIGLINPITCEICGKGFEWDGQSTLCMSCAEMIVKANKNAKAKGEDEVLVCADNRGVEDRFDIGIEYLVEDHKDKDMVYVYDKLGRKDEYFRDRFVQPR